MTRTLAAIAIAAILPACSFSARGYHAATSTSCSTSRAAPIVDTAAAFAGAAAFGYGASRGLAEDNRSVIMGTGFAGALIFATSAIAGYTWAGDCRGAGAVEARRTARR